MIYGVCLRYFKNDQDAYDITMFLFELLPKRIKGKDIDNFRPWLYTVVKNHCFEVLRKKGKDVKKQSQADFMYSEQVFHPDHVVQQELIV